MRLRKTLVAVFAGSVFVTAACSESGSEKKPPPADHSTSRTAAQPFGAAGPAPGQFRKAWQADVPAPPLSPQPRIDFVAGQIVVTSSRGLDTYDGRTGAPRWHYYERSRQLAGITTTADAVVVTTRAMLADGSIPLDDKTADLRTTGFDAATGRVLWRADRFQPLDGGVPTAYEPVKASSGGVVVLRDRTTQRKLIGVDARTGRQRWTWTVPRLDSSCHIDPLDSDGSLLSLNVNCHPHADVYALDPATGAVRWQRLSGNTRSTVQGRTRSGITMLTRTRSKGRSTGFALIGADGREILKASPRRLELAVGASGLAVVGDRAVVNYADGDGEARGSKVREWIGIVNLRTGRLERRVEEHEVSGLVTVGGRVYGVRSWLGEYDGKDSGLDPFLVPSALAVIDPATARVTTVPMPFPRSGFWRPETMLDKMWAVGDRVYMARLLKTGLRLAAYTPSGARSPVELGGARQGDWSNACALLKGAGFWARELHSLDKTLALGRAMIRNPRCYLDGGSEFWIGWVAPTAQQADELLDASGSGAKAVPNIGDEAYEVPHYSARRLVVRAGRYIVLFEGDGAPSADQDMLAAARVVARRLASQ
ncbi:PQQ-binding-like beta-propeller repeat protein [Actinomadura sp. HBU206391]|uniref:outer membrane protein assembly factor BamB family protein n=1 Tax=Actinomadura sp. HBU206391 TaxID=2731692 RepID=UPI00164F017F|nr:PQQ-binding-like beta-propeller repeat protein [Actinomadura sp. HBU206391]MBC6462553.1 PQQ-binding-like beta-propeller repeat protein [Actinomadura sp. HBU206391]